MRPHLLVVSFAAALAQAALAADDSPATTPYRPSVSTPAALSAPGWLEIEAGYQHDHAGDGARRDSVPTTFKLAFSPDWGIRIGNEAWVRQQDAAGRTSGVGDTGVVLKRRFAIDEAQVFGLEAGVNIPTGRRGIGSGSGKPDYAVNAIYSADLGDWHTDLNLVTTRLGQVDPGASRQQLLWAASLSRSLDDRWSVVGELSGTHQRGADATSQFLLAASYNLGKQLTLDAGAARSLRSGPPLWSAFTGFTWLAARLF
ncbi:MAG: transporter [Caldimonas sp.]